MPVKLERDLQSQDMNKASAGNQNTEIKLPKKLGLSDPRGFPGLLM